MLSSSSSLRVVVFMSSLTRWSEVRLSSLLATNELVRAGAVLLLSDELFAGVEQVVDGFEVCGAPGVPVMLALGALRKRGVDEEELVFFAVKPGCRDPLLQVEMIGETSAI